MPIPSDKQKAARARNHYIFRLRGFHASAGFIQGERGMRIQALIDEELESLGAETQSIRRYRERQQLWYGDA